MTVRSDWTFELLLEKARDECTSDSVRSAVQAALTFMHSAPKTPRRGGRQLTENIRLAQLEAETVGEAESIQILQSSLDYAENNTRRRDVEERYKLFKESRHDGLNPKFIGQTVRASIKFWTSVSAELLDKTPSTTAQELLDHISTTRSTSH